MKIVVIIVLYNKKISDSETLCSIEQVAINYNLSSYDLIIYDNSPEEQEIPSNYPLNLFYYHDNLNGGLSAAYNYAYHYCIENKKQWLLLLDQDTELTNEYFLEIGKTIINIHGNENIVCIVPKIESNKKIISPVIYKTGGFVKPISENAYGVNNVKITGINSGTLLKVNFINFIGGFNNSFKLDMLDYWYFEIIYQMKKNIFILSSKLNHSLSISNFNSIELKRYINIINSELFFIKNFKSLNDYFVYKLRLFFRFIKQLFFVKNKKICIVTFKYLFYNF